MLTFLTTIRDCKLEHLVLSVFCSNVVVVLGQMQLGVIEEKLNSMKKDIFRELR